MREPTETELFHPEFPGDENFKRRQPILIFLNGAQMGRVILLAKDAVVFGRSPEAGILVNDKAMSRLHSRVWYCAETAVYKVSDLESSNGTFINDGRITESDLAEGDKIIMGQTVLRFSWGDSLDVHFQGEMEKLICVDELTGLAAKRLFDEELVRHVAVARSAGTPLSLLMMDMDGLKKINDTHGHSFGAFSIRETGLIIGRIVHGQGMASRFGGDEFMAFLDEMPLKQACVLGEEIRLAVLEHCYLKDGIRLQPTISIGVASLVIGEDAAGLFQRADEALYRAKQGGRNRVCK